VSRLPRIKFTGSRGSWLARAGCDLLPVIHNTWYDGAGRYHDPMVGAKLDGAKYRSFVEALASGDRAIMQNTPDRSTFARKGYVGLFRYEDFVIDDDGAITLRIVERLADPR
jgi:hypothetical protein